MPCIRYVCMHATRLLTERVTSQLIIYPLVEKFGIRRFRKNADKAKDGLLHVLDKLRAKGELFFASAVTTEAAAAAAAAATAESRASNVSAAHASVVSMSGNGSVSGSVLTVKNYESMLPFKTNYSAAAPLLLSRKCGRHASVRWKI